MVQNLKMRRKLSVDGVLGIGTLARRIDRAGESTELLFTCPMAAALKILILLF